ncbi:hypothetical protein B6N60_04502 [Richelia sinica FACHB-800]|uniref:Uncharacterized protein n=1 Tax=Richelia sinica FACHB-800 TaxID=1357546 RepID=A0A975Y6Z6_9NOST|nr:hypothetical protein [Richelia sinica]MBD2665696.1 hypothetical protein [Richelia sinica FACHB-800]QXE25782.1 hypothetical protein B6N60_04502 [Richelia sinica FACHB-800]
MTPIELYRKGFQALVDALGYVDAIRFIRQFDNGNGDYTEERHQWLDEVTMDEILADIKKYQETI